MPAADGRAAASVVGLDFDATVAWPKYDWMGVAKAAFESTRPLPRPRPRAARASGCNLVAAGPLRTMAAKSIPGFDEFEAVWATRAPLGWDLDDPEPAARACVALLSDWFPRDHRRDRARRRRRPRDGRLTCRCSPDRPLRFLDGPEPVLPAPGGEAHPRPVGGCRRSTEADGPAARRGRIGLRGRHARRGRQRAAAAVRCARVAKRSCAQSRRRRARPGWPSASAPAIDADVASSWPTRGGTGPGRGARRAVAGARPLVRPMPRGRPPRSCRGRRRRDVRCRRGGPGPDLPSPRIPVVAVTGTNGKTTTTRMIAHIAHGGRAAYRLDRTPTASTCDGELVEAGDYSGPSGAGRVLAEPGVAARGHRDRPRRHPAARAWASTYNDVSVVTNVTADHLGLQGIDTLDQLAEVKAVITAITRPQRLGGAQRRRPAGLRDAVRGPRRKPWVFSRDPDSPSSATALDEGGRAATVIDG